MIVLAMASALCLAGATPGGVPPEVTVRVLSRYHPRAVEIARSGEAHVAAASHGTLLVDGVAAEGSRTFTAGTWRVSARGAPVRRYVGAVTVTASGDEVAVTLRMPIEEHVAAVVAAESEAHTPPEALKALAVVARSYAAAASGRHDGFDVCDLAHCQVMGGAGRTPHDAEARAAARATAGEVMRLPDGRVAEAVFHGACGGHTGDPREIFGGEGTGAVAVPDPGCPEAPWSATVSRAVLGRVAAKQLHPAARSPAPVRMEQLRLVRGAGGFVVQVGDGASWAGGEAFARALDRALGHGRVRSSRLEIRLAGDSAQVVGTGIGHGVGLCQAGAARRAAEGEGYEAILGRYLAGARLSR